jgi:hypothetical protein
MQTRDAEAEEMPKKSFGDLIDLLPFPFGQRSWWVDGTTHVAENYQEARLQS